MKTSLLIFAAAAVPLTVQAVSVTLPGTAVTATSPDGSTAPATGLTVSGVAEVSINTTTTGTSTTEGWTAAATGSTSIDAASGLASLDLQSRTVIGPGSISFTTDSTATGLTNLLPGVISGVVGPVAGAGLIQTWSATANTSTLEISLAPNTTYALTFNLAQSTSLLGALSPAVFNNFTAIVGDSDSTFGQGSQPAGLLGITDILNGSGLATLTFTTDAVINGPVTIRFGASTLADTNLLSSLLGQDATLYSVSGINVNPIPEPSSLAMAGGLLGMMTLVRRRCR